MKAIETQYKGYRFRSRLEARYAVLFDALRIEWEYEPEGYVLDDGTHYLADFFLRFPRGSSHRYRWPDGGYWVEIKPLAPNPDEVRKLRQLSEQSGHCAWFFVGVPGDATAHEAGARMPSQLQWSVPMLICGVADGFHRAVKAARSARFGKDGRA